MDQVLSSTFRDAVYGWLSYVESLVYEADMPSRAALAEHDLIRLSGMVRALLAEHEPDGDGRCRSCTGRWSRHRAHPCSVWTTAHRHLIVLDDVTGGGRHAEPHVRKHEGWSTPKISGARER